MKYTHRKRVLQVPAARTTRHWLKRIKISDNLSLYRFFKIFIHNISEDEIMDRSNGVAYNFILAIFPTIIFLFTLIPYITDFFPQVSNETIMVFLSDYMPESMYEVISSTVLDILGKQRGGLLTFGFVLALFLATNGMMALMRAFNACYRTVENRGFLRMRLTATGLTVMLTATVIFAVLLLVIGEIAINKVTTDISDFSHTSKEGLSLIGVLIIRFAVIFIVFFFAVSFIYYFGPAVHYNWKFFSIGSFIATLACLAVSYGFSFYVSNFASYNKVYGSIGVLIALMVWIQLLTAVLLFGYEINASLHYGQKLEAVDQHQRIKRREKSMR
jgi:membrane protein